MSRLAISFSCLLLLAIAASPAAAKDQPWEASVRKARKTQDRDVREAQRRKSAEHLVTIYKSRVARQKTVLNLYLVGRAQFYAAQIDATAKRADQAKARIGDAAGFMEQARRAEPRFWFADLGLAQLYLMMNRIPEAEAALQRVLRVKPQEIDALKVGFAVSQKLKRWSWMASLARTAVGVEPDVPEYRAVLVEALSRQQKLDEAIRELDILTRMRPSDVRLVVERAMLKIRYAFAKTGCPLPGQPNPKQLEPDATLIRQAVNDLERVHRVLPKNYGVLAMLEEGYVHLRDDKNVKRILEKMLPLAKEAVGADEEARVRRMLDQIAKGARLSAPPRRPGAGGANPLPENVLSQEEVILQLVDGATRSKEAARRRQALEVFLEMDLGQVPVAIYKRLDATLEPDPGCRLLIVRLLGRTTSEGAIKHIARAVWDDDAGVRAVALTELGRFTHPGVLTYLLTAFINLQVDPLPTEADALRQLTGEYRALREAVHNHTRYRDRELMATGQLPLAEFSTNRRKWMAFFASARGQLAILDALRVFEELNDPYPERHVLYLAANERETIEIRRAAYEIMLRRYKRAMQTKDGWDHKRWKDFPTIDPANLVAPADGQSPNAVVRDLKTNLLRWWRARNN